MISWRESKKDGELINSGQYVYLMNKLHKQFVRFARYGSSRDNSQNYFR